MSSFAQQLLTDILQAQGADEPTARRFAQAVLVAEVAAELLSVAKLDAWERDARIYHLRGQRVKCVDLASRFTMNRATVFAAIRRHQARRRAALRTVA